MKASGIAPGVWFQAREGFRSQPGEHIPEHAWDYKIAPLFTDADEYYRGTSELHVHYAIGDRNGCIVLESSMRGIPSGDFYGHDLTAAFEDNRSSHLPEAPGDNGQPLVPVFIGEPVDEVKGMLLRRIPTRIKRHQFLEDCDRLRGAYVVREAVPAVAVLRPLLVLRCDVREVPHWLTQDRAEHFAALPGWDQGAHQIIEGCAQVVNDIASDQAGIRVRGFRELQIGEALAALVLDGIRNRVWVFIREGLEPHCQIDNVLFGPVGLTDI